MRAIRISEASPGPDNLNVTLEEVPRPEPGPDQCLVEIQAAGVNSSDVKGLLGLMHKCVWPRTPGRDYTGVVVAGPPGLMGKTVWGSGGDLGMGVDGAHAEYIVVGAQTAAPAPENLSPRERAALGVPFCTAYIGLIEYCALKPGETVAVFGANGAVGRAVTQMALAHDARVIAIVRPGTGAFPHPADGVTVIEADGDDIAPAIAEYAGEQGVEIAFNTVGAPYFQPALDALGHLGKQVIINAIEPKTVPFNLFAFYRKQARLIGMASMSSTSADLGKVLSQLTPLFERGALTPFAIRDDHVFSLENAVDAYQLALAGTSRDRVVIDPNL